MKNCIKEQGDRIPAHTAGRQAPGERTVQGHPKGDEGVEDAEDDGGLHHAVVVQLTQVLDAAHAALVVPRVVDLGQHTNMLVVVRSSTLTRQ